MDTILGKLMWIAVVLLFCNASAFAGNPARKTKWEESVPRFAYVHLGLGGNFFVVGSEDMERALAPFEMGPVNFGYSYYMTTGIRNIAQLELRKGEDSNSFFYDEGLTRDFKIKRTTIPVKFKHEEWLVKMNPVFFVRKLRTWAFFIVWGKGDVDYADKAGDGFLNGKKTITGLELSRIFKFFAIGSSIEKHNMTFERFSVNGFGSLVQDFDASYLQFNVRFAVGLGI